MKKIVIVVVSILLLSVILVILQVNQIVKSVSRSVVKDEILELDEQLRVYENSNNKKEIVINNINFGDELFQKIKFKGLKRVTREEWMEMLQDTNYYLEYSSGKESFYIDKEGRILDTKDKGDIRNSSVLHWLWWKFDNISDNNTGIYYLSEPDKSILDFINGETN